VTEGHLTQFVQRPAKDPTRHHGLSISGLRPSSRHSFVSLSQTHTAFPANIIATSSCRAQPAITALVSRARERKERESVWVWMWTCRAQILYSAERETRSGHRSRGVTDHSGVHKSQAVSRRPPHPPKTLHRGPIDKSKTLSTTTFLTASRPLTQQIPQLQGREIHPIVSPAGSPCGFCKGSRPESPALDAKAGSWSG